LTAAGNNSKKLIITGSLTGCLYLFFYWLHNRFGELNLHTPVHLKAIVVTLAILYIIYFWALLKVKFNSEKIKLIFGFAILFNTCFIFIPFFTSNDLHSYIASGRVVNYGANPYLTPYNNFASDKLYPFINNFWSAKTTLYGPLFLYISSFINILGNSSYTLTVFLFKTFLIFINILNGYLIYKITHLSKAAFIYSWNPLIIYELSANAHNESLVIFFVLLSFYFIKIKRFYWSFLFLTLSFLLKYSTLILVPFYLAVLLKTNLSFNKKLVNLILIFLICFVVTVVFYLPFWGGTKIFSYLLIYYRGQTISPSIGIWLLDKLVSYQLAFTLNNFLFIFVGGLIGLWFLIKKYSFQKLSWVCLGVYWLYIFTKLSLVLSWYLAPLIALSAINLKYHKRTTFMTILSLAAYHLLLYWFVK